LETRTHRFADKTRLIEEEPLVKIQHLATLGVAAAALTLSIGTAEAAQGCGPGGWRNYWGQCRYSAPVVVQASPVIYTEPPVVQTSNVCPAGYWPGPWGHCRDTPFHGRLPNGEWQ
jgi:hypothetical protein